MVSTDPYRNRDEPRPSRFDSALTGLRSFNTTLSSVVGIAFVVIGIGAVIAAPITSEFLLVPIGLFAILLGAVRVFLARRR